jgi:phospholipase C
MKYLMGLLILLLMLSTLAAAQTCPCTCGATPSATATATYTTTTTPSPVPATPTATPTIAATPTPAPIQHIVIIDMENHTYDSMFGTMTTGDGATVAQVSSGAIQPLSECPDKMPSDLPHDWNSANIALDNGLMDHFDLTADCGAGYTYPYECICQYYQSDIPNFWALATQYARFDQFFTSVLGPSFPNHLFTVAAQANNVESNPAGIGLDPVAYNWGCDSRSTAIVYQAYALNNPPTNGINYAKVHNISPCMDFPVLPDLLNAAGLTWTYYSPPIATSGFEWNSLDAISHIRYGAQWATNIKATSTIMTDAANGTLANVSWLVEPDDDSAHPDYSMCVDENTVVGLVNVLMEGPEANSTAIFITFDDWGGFYDHVTPPVCGNRAGGDLTGCGFRVPLMVISPYAKQGYVSHVQTEFSSLVTEAENNFGLGRLTGLPNGALARDGMSNDLSDAFNFSQSPRTWTPLTTRTCP